MTSTSFSVGLMEARNSSRVLRPPGGGHTDIFGVRSEDDIQKPAQKEMTSTAGMEEGSTEEHEKMEKVKQSDNENPSLIKDSPRSQKAEEKPQEAQQLTNIAPQRKRIPPGGYSSGLW